MEKYSEIATECLILRRLRVSDWQMISYLRTDKEVNQFVKRPSAATKEEALSFISKINNGIENQSFYYWVITEKDVIEEMIGSICLWNFSEDKKTAEVGYDLSPKFQGKGIMDESMKAVLTFGFDKLHLNKIEAYTSSFNKSSVKLLERNGFVLNRNRKDNTNADNAIFELQRRS